MNKFQFGLILILVLASACATNNDLVEKTVQQKKAEIYYGEGTNLLVRKEYANALINLIKAKENDPNDSQIRNNLGMAYYFREQMALAEQEIRKAIELDKNNTDARVNLGSLYLEQNRVKEAKAQYELALNDLTYKNQFRNYYNLAVISLKVGDRKEAFDFLFKSIKEKEDYCQAHYKLGELYQEEYKFKQALESFQESSKGTCVNEPAPHYQQSLALMNLGRYEEARTKLKTLIEKFPKSPFNTLAQTQLKKIAQNIHEQALNKTYKTEVVKESQTIESPNF